MAPGLLTKVPLKAYINGGDVQSIISVVNDTDKAVEAGKEIHLKYWDQHTVIELDDELVPGESVKYSPWPPIPSGGGPAEAYYYTRTRVLSPSMLEVLKNTIAK